MFYTEKVNYDGLLPSLVGGFNTVDTIKLDAECNHLFMSLMKCDIVKTFGLNDYHQELKINQALTYFDFVIGEALTTDEKGFVSLSMMKSNGSVLKNYRDEITQNNCVPNQNAGFVYNETNLTDELKKARLEQHKMALFASKAADLFYDINVGTSTFSVSCIRHSIALTLCLMNFNSNYLSYLLLVLSEIANSKESHPELIKIASILITALTAPGYKANFDSSNFEKNITRYVNSGNNDFALDLTFSEFLGVDQNCILVTCPVFHVFRLLDSLGYATDDTIKKHNLFQKLSIDNDTIQKMYESLIKNPSNDGFKRHYFDVAKVGYVT